MSSLEKAQTKRTTFRLIVVGNLQQTCNSWKTHPAYFPLKLENVQQCYQLRTGRHQLDPGTPIYVQKWSSCKSCSQKATLPTWKQGQATHSDLISTSLRRIWGSLHSLRKPTSTEDLWLVTQDVWNNRPSSFKNRVQVYLVELMLS